MGGARVDEQTVGPDLVLSTDRDGSRAVLTVRGELDAYSAPGLEDQVRPRFSTRRVYARFSLRNAVSAKTTAT
jgi:hypothetical protein